MSCLGGLSYPPKLVCDIRDVLPRNLAPSLRWSWNLAQHFVMLCRRSRWIPKLLSWKTLNEGLRQCKFTGSSSSPKQSCETRMSLGVHWRVWVDIWIVPRFLQISSSLNKKLVFSSDLPLWVSNDTIFCRDFKTEVFVFHKFFDTVDGSSSTFVWFLADFAGLPVMNANNAMETFG